MSRWLPSVAVLAILIAAAGVLLTTVGASEPAGADSDASARDGEGVAAACLEGSLECNDTVDLPLDEGDASDVPVAPPDAGPDVESATVQLTIDFTASVTQADIDRVTEVISSIDPLVRDILILERFPPAASATISASGSGVCDDLVARFEALPAVASASCADTAVPPVDPDAPVTSDPLDKPPEGEGSPPSAGDCPPDAGACVSPPFDPGATE
jgi:hypothetical protein